MVIVFCKIMKKNIILLTFTLIAILFVGCKIRRVEHIESDGFVWYEISKEGLKGAVDKENNVLLPPIFGSLVYVKFDSNAKIRSLKKIEITNDYLLEWEGTDDNGDTIKIKQLSLNCRDTFAFTIIDYPDNENRYYYDDGEKKYQHRVKILDNEGLIIIDDYFDWNINTDYNRVPYGGYGESPKQFKGRQNGTYVIYNEKGKIVIPSGRYNRIHSFQFEGKCFYVAYDKSGTKLVIIDSKGDELVRINKADLTFEGYYSGEKANKNKELQLAILYPLYYNSSKGIGVLNNKKGYQDEILWSHIFIPEYSNTFDIEPSTNHKIAQTVDLRYIARKYRNDISGANNNNQWNDNLSIYNPNQPIQQSAPTYSETPAKQWRTITREVDCTFCWHSGKCNTCNGKGWYNNPFGTGIVNCPNCTNGNCSHCGGRGSITKTEQVYD